MGRLHAINGLSLELVLKIAELINQVHLEEIFYVLAYNYIWRFFDFSECFFRAPGESENQNFFPAVAAGKKSITFKIYGHFFRSQTHVSHFRYNFLGQDNHWVMVERVERKNETGEGQNIIKAIFSGAPDLFSIAIKKFGNPEHDNNFHFDV